jgi:hypothetical protein
MRTFALFFLTAACWLPSSSAYATVVQKASLQSLVRSSHVVLHGTVVSVERDLSQNHTGPFLTRISLEVKEPLKGLPPETSSFVLTVPGGRAGKYSMHVPGMPVLNTHDEVVLLLEKTGQGSWIYTGLSQGVFYIQRPRQGAPYVHQSHGDVMFVGEGVEKDALPSTLHGLLKTLRSYIRHGEQP